MRLFVAINFNEKTRALLCDSQESLRASAKRGRFTHPNNLHLTLVFLGECDIQQFQAAKDALSPVSFTPFELVVEKIGRFKRNSGDLWWAGIRLTEELQALQSDVAHRLRSAGFSLESRAYKPHVTLAREVIGVRDVEGLAPFGEIVSSIDLMKSERINGRLTYTPVFTIHSIH